MHAVEQKMFNDIGLYGDGQARSRAPRVFFELCSSVCADCIESIITRTFTSVCGLLMLFCARFTRWFLCLSENVIFMTARRSIHCWRNGRKRRNIRHLFVFTSFLNMLMYLFIYSHIEF